MSTNLDYDYLESLDNFEVLHMYEVHLGDLTYVASDRSGTLMSEIH